MKPRNKLATARTPDGCEMQLFEHDGDFSIKVTGQELMNSRQHESELELARLGCASLVNHEAPRVLIGGLGLGYTLRQTLDMLSPQSEVIVSELLDAVVEWNYEFLGDLNDHPLKDDRVEVKRGDVVKLIANSKAAFDAILLDVDNGPSAFTDSGNQRLYGRRGIAACRQALRENGCLAVWSCASSKTYEEQLVKSGFHVRRYRASAYKGSKSQNRFVWVASENENVLPPGGGEPRISPKKNGDGFVPNRSPVKPVRGSRKKR